MKSNARDYQIRVENDDHKTENTSEENSAINPDRNADWIKRANNFEEQEAEDLENNTDSKND